MSFQHRAVITPWICFRRTICLGYLCYRGQEGEASPSCHPCVSWCCRHPKPDLIRGNPHDRSIDPTAHWLSSITQVSCQHFPEEFSSRKRKTWECAYADACFALYTDVKACISTKAKWTFVIQIVAFLLIWNLFLNECHRICEKSKVRHCRKFRSTLQKGLINIIYIWELQLAHAKMCII